MILNSENIEAGTSPFPHFIIEEAFSDFNELERAFPKSTAFTSSMRMDSDMTYPMPNYISLITNEKSYNKLHNFVYSEEFINYFLDLFRPAINDKLESGELAYDPFNLPIISSPFEEEIHTINDNLDQTPFLFPRLDLGIGGANYGKANGGAGIHTDNAGRLISILYYVNTPSDMEGGEHRMWGVKDQKTVLNKEVKPKCGRLLASLQTNYALHDVNPVTKINGYRKAFYLAISCNKPLWNESEQWLMKLTSNRDPSKHKRNFKSMLKKLVKK